MLRKMNETAADQMLQYIERYGMDNKKLIDYAYAIATKYGEGSASLAAMMYEAIAEAEGLFLPAAEVAATATYSEVAKTINGTLKTGNKNIVSRAVGTLVKKAGADTTLKNAIRDKAEFAWIPSGDTCAYCLTLASKGWQPISADALKNGHAEHIHANCDCNYAVRFSKKTNVAGYKPEKYKEIYDNAEGETGKEKINSIRRRFYEQNREKILEQKKIAYEARKED